MPIGIYTDVCVYLTFNIIIQCFLSTISPITIHFNVELFWQRLQTNFQDVTNEKLKTYPIAATRIYPCMRRVAVEAVEYFKVGDWYFCSMFLCLIFFIFVFV